VAQAPVAGAALLVAGAAPTAALEEGWRPRLRRTVPANVCVGLLFGSLVLGLVGLALIPSPSAAYVVAALAFCGAGLGLAVPFLSHAALDPTTGLSRSGTLTVGVRHAGLVLAL